MNNFCRQSTRTVRFFTWHKTMFEPCSSTTYGIGYVPWCFCHSPETFVPDDNWILAFFQKNEKKTDLRFYSSPNFILKNLCDVFCVYVLFVVFGTNKNRDWQFRWYFATAVAVNFLWAKLCVIDGENPNSKNNISSDEPTLTMYFWRAPFGASIKI